MSDTHVQMNRRSRKKPQDPYSAGGTESHYNVAAPLAAPQTIGGGTADKFAAPDAAGFAAPATGNTWERAPTVGEVDISAGQVIVTTEAATPAKHKLHGFHPLEIDIPRNLIVGSEYGVSLIVFLPNRSVDGMHTVKKNCVIAVDAGGAEVNVSIKPERGDLSDAVQGSEEVKSAIKDLVAVSIGRHRDTDWVKEVLTEGIGWGSTVAAAPMIEDLVVRRVDNQMQYHVAGVVVREGGENGSKDMVSYDYIDAKGTRKTRYQAIVPPFAANSINTDMKKHSGTLLRHEKQANANPFVANTILTPTFEADRGVSGDAESMIGDYVDVNFDSPEVLWGMEHLDGNLKAFVALLATASGLKGVERFIVNADNKTHVSSVIHAISANVADKNISATSVLISKNVATLRNLAPPNNNEGWFMFHYVKRHLRYRMPKALYAIIVKNFVAKLRGHQVFNGGTDLIVRADAIPLSNAEGVTEEHTSVIVSACITYFQSVVYHCYLPETS
jgi:hypothetical protein